MLDTFIQELIRRQRPYYLLQGSPIKGVDNQYWLIFKHRDADNLLHNIVTFLGIGDKHAAHRLVRIDRKSAKVITYTPLRDGSLPSVTLLRTSNLATIEKFLKKESTTKEKTLLAGSFLEIKGRRRKFNLPDELDKYNSFICNVLERTQIYRRSTAYFDSGVLKLHEEPLREIVVNEGQIRLLMDWQGFTKRADIDELEKLHDPNYRAQFACRTLNEFLKGLEDSAFNGTEILAELIRLELLQIKLVKMESGRGIYHRKTGIFSDSLDNHIWHEGSDNFTRAAYSRNAESVTFFYSWDSQLDSDDINNVVSQFDAEWQRQDITFDLSHEFLQQVQAERDRRAQLQQPIIESITPDEFTPGQTTSVEITGKNLDRVEEIQVADDELVKVTIDTKEPEHITGRVEVDSNHPPIELNNFQVTTDTGTYPVSPEKSASVSQTLEIPDFSEIEGFKQAVETILVGKHGTPQDFRYWLAQQRPHQFRVERSETLDELLNQGTLFEHQKSGAQHCLRVMQDFGIAICADAVGLGKTRLAGAVARLYREQNHGAKIVIVAAKKLLPNWEREMQELGFKYDEYTKDYELFNKNLMSRKGGSFLDYFRLYNPDLIIIDEAHEGIRNYKNRIHKTCAVIQERDRASGRQRHFLLLTATPWNNRREDIYNILSPFLSHPEGFTNLGFPPQVAQWFQNRNVGVERFTDNTELFRRIYRELFLQRTRQMLRDATPNLNMYAKRIAQWLPVQFESGTELALDQIFTSFETSLYIPFADPIRYLNGSVEQRSLLSNQRRFFLQRAESSMYALRRTIKRFGERIEQMQERLNEASADAEGLAEGLKEFLLQHYGFSSEVERKESTAINDSFAWNEDYEEDEEDENEETEEEQQQKRSSLRRSIDIATDALKQQPEKAQAIHEQMLADCESDLVQLEQIQRLLVTEFVVDHKREQVTRKVRELVSQGCKVLLISTFSDTVIDYYRYMARDEAIASKGIGMAIGSTKRYYPDDASQSLTVNPINALRGTRHQTNLKRQQVFQLFAPDATCKTPSERPKPEEEIAVLIGSETLSVGQNLQDADYLINIDLPWNPMILEQRIGRIDRPKKHRTENIFIYYANSESQLLRQASRLSNLHKKLVGEIATEDEAIPTIPSIDTLGASIYGDTMFDDEVLPGYIDFLNSLVKARKMEQGNLQEDTYRKQETHRDLYTQNEILHSEDLTGLIEQLGDRYQANPIALGRCTGEKEEPKGLVALSLQYFGPNGEPIPEQQQTLFWNDQTGERDGYGVAIATAAKTPVAGDVFSAKYLLSCAQKLYDQLVILKQQRMTELEQPETLKNITIASDRISRINRRVSKLVSLPAGLELTEVKDTFEKLNAWREKKDVQKLLRNYTDGEQSKLDNATFITQLVRDTDKLNLITLEGTKLTSLQVSLIAFLLRA